MPTSIYRANSLYSRTYRALSIQSPVFRYYSRHTKTPYLQLETQFARRRVQAVYTYVVTKRTHREKEREEERKDWQRGFAIPYRENLCFNNYCDIGARVRKANQRRCVRVSGADGRTRPTDRQTGSESSGPDRGGTRRSRGCESLRGGCPLRQDGLLAFLHHRAATAPRLFASSSFARDASSRRATR